MSSSPLMARELHEKWKAKYRTPENFTFYDKAYSAIQQYLGRIDGRVLDAGCGTGEKAIRLARFGYRVVGIDYAPVAIDEARDRVVHAGQTAAVRLMRGDLTTLPFPDASFDAVVIWGVLMHVPELERAIAELCRVLKPAGKIVVYDAHASSLDVRLLKWAKRLTGRGRNTRTTLGIENWVGSAETPVLLRWMYDSALRRLFDENGIAIERRRAGRFTELFVYLDNAALRRMVHAWNNVYFETVRWPLPAYGVMVFGRKRPGLARSTSPSGAPDAVATPGTGAGLQARDRGSVNAAS